MSPQAKTEAVQLVAWGDNELLCPKCGESNAHHSRISVYQRSENRSWVQRIIIIGDKVTSNTVISEAGNPSLRRHGLAIEFSCEQCGSIGELTIAQHKGQTLINWR